MKKILASFLILVIILMVPINVLARDLTYWPEGTFTLFWNNAGYWIRASSYIINTDSSVTFSYGYYTNNYTSSIADINWEQAPQNTLTGVTLYVTPTPTPIPNIIDKAINFIKNAVSGLLEKVALNLKLNTSVQYHDLNLKLEAVASAGAPEEKSYEINNFDIQLTKTNQDSQYTYYSVKNTYDNTITNFKIDNSTSIFEYDLTKIVNLQNNNTYRFTLTDNSNNSVVLIQTYTYTGGASGGSIGTITPTPIPTSTPITGITVSPEDLDIDEKIPVIPLKNALEKLTQLKTIDYRALRPEFKINLNSLLKAGTDEVAPMSVSDLQTFENETTFLEFTALERIKFLDVSLIDYFRNLLQLAMIGITLYYVWQKIPRSIG